MFYHHHHRDDVVCRMQEREREWIASIEASIESKDARSRSIQQQRAAARNRQVRHKHTHTQHVAFDMKTR